MSRISPLCPHCGASASAGATFRAAEVRLSDRDPLLGETMEAALQLDCLACDRRFPLWTYVVGDSSSWRANALDEAGRLWDPNTGRVLAAMVPLGDFPIRVA